MAAAALGQTLATWRLLPRAPGGWQGRPGGPRGPRHGKQGGGIGMVTWATPPSVSYVHTDTLTSETGLHRDKTNVILEAEAQVCDR